MPNSSSQSHHNKRRHIRFDPGPLDIIAFDDRPQDAENANVDDESNFEAQFVGLPYSESYGGCGALIRAHKNLSEGQTVQVQLGKLAPLRAKIAWIKKAPMPEFSLLGLEFLD